MNGTLTIVLNQTSDVDIGILINPTDLSTTFQTSGTVPYNSVRVRTTIDSTHGGALNFLLAGVVNQVSITLQTQATATAEVHPIISLKPISGYNVPLLPITMSQSEWLSAVNGTSGADNYTYNPTTNRISAGPDGLYEVQLYPSIISTSSNHGLLEFATTSHSDSLLKQEITSGPTYAQTTTQWPPSGVPPWNSQHQFTINDNSCLQSNTFYNLITLMNTGQARLIPLNDGTSPGTGNGTYTIVAFAAVRLVYAKKAGNNGIAIVQPAVLSDPSLVAGTTLVSSGEGGVPEVLLTRQRGATEVAVPSERRTASPPSEAFEFPSQSRS
jgi:hypothetical protein